MERLSDRQLLRLYNAAKAISAREADMMPDVVKLCEELMEFRALQDAADFVQRNGIFHPTEED